MNYTPGDVCFDFLPCPAQLLSFILILNEIKKARKFKRLKCDQIIEYLLKQNVSSEKKWPVTQAIGPTFGIIKSKKLSNNPLESILTIPFLTWIRYTF